jgi:hypothetical protein
MNGRLIFQDAGVFIPVSAEKEGGFIRISLEWQSHDM